MAAFGEIVSLAGAQDHEAAWRDLAQRADPNPFGEADFVLPALEQFGGAQLAFIWAGPDRGALIAVAALSPPPARFGFARVWRSEQAALAAWLIDPTTARAAFNGLAWVVRHLYPFCAGFIVPRVAAAGALARATEPAEIFNRVRRAAVDFASPQTANPKRSKEWGRLRRRLAERGALETRASGDAAAFERFLALEEKGWKGARGTALASAPERAAFARATAAGFSARRRLAVHELLSDGAPIAAGVLLMANRRAFFWKIAYDEGYAAFSPGVLLTLALTRSLAESGEVDLIDSCAMPDHPMIDHVWPGRLEFVDLAIPNGAAPFFEPWLVWERNAPRLKEDIKRMLLPLLGRKRS